MLFLSSLAAAFAPVQEGVEEGGSTDSTTQSSTIGSTGDPAPSEPQLIRQGLDASQKQPLTIRADAGDQLQLRVTSRRSGTIELAGIGPTEDVGPEQPALFDVLLEAEGTYPVRFLETEREIAQIEVR